MVLFPDGPSSASGGASHPAISESNLENPGRTPKAHFTPEATQRFDAALHKAATSNSESMATLRRSVCECVTALKDANIGDVDMILTMKMFIRDSVARSRAERDELPLSNINSLTDPIVKWAIEEYYRIRS